MGTRDELSGWLPQRVLVGYDGSPGGDDAVALAGLLSRDGGEVVLANVLPSPSSLPGAVRLLRHDEWPDADGFFDAATAALPNRAVECQTYFGSPARVLDELAAAGSFDLLSLGSPHLTGFGRAVGGSVGEALLHGAPGPIACAPRGFAARGPQPPTRIAVAYDGSPEAEAALRRAESLAIATGAHLLILTVDSLSDPVSSVYSYTLHLPDGEAILAEAIKSIDPRIEAEGRLLDGEVDRALVEACEAASVDLLVTGSRGYGPGSRVLLGSVSSHLVYESPCPVLVEARPHLDAPTRDEGRAAGLSKA